MYIIKPFYHVLRKYIISYVIWENAINSYLIYLNSTIWAGNSDPGPGI